LLSNTSNYHIIPEGISTPDSNLAYRAGALPNFAITAFSEVR